MKIKTVVLSAIVAAFLAIPAMAGQLFMQLGDSEFLPDCGGTIQVKKSGNGNGEQVNLIFRDVKQCSNFDITSSTYQTETYKRKKIGTEGNRSGSFTIPKRFIDGGVNSISIVVRSNSGKTQDNVEVQFFAVQDPVVVPVPVPVHVNNGNGW